MTIIQTPFFQRQPVGEQIFTTPGTTNFIVPNDVYFISAVCIGGGGGGGDGASGSEVNGGGGGALAWVSNLPVFPGENLTINVGAAGTGGQGSGTAGPSRIARGATILIAANGGTNASNTSGLSGTTAGGTFTFDASIVGVSGITTGGGVGGIGGNSTAGSGGGGGAGGYSGAGGAGGLGATSSADGANGTGGGGGGGEASPSGQANNSGGGGGGTGLYGEGDNGIGGTGNASTAGTGGSGGFNGTGGASGNSGGNYGGGAAGAHGNIVAQNGGQGAVRIIYGPNRFYPTTNTDVQVSYATSSTSSASTIIIPSNAQAGDIAFLFDGASNSTTTAPTNVLPSGWTQVSTSLVNDATTSLSMRSTISYLILDTSNIGATITGINGTVNRKTILVFRPNFKVDSLTLSTPTASTTISDVVSQTMDLVEDNPSRPVIAFAHMRATGTISTPTVSSGFTQIQNTTLQYTYYLIDNSVNTLSSVTVDFADSGTNSLISFYASFNGIYS